MNDFISNSSALNNLAEAFNEFNSKIKSGSGNGPSDIGSLVTDINQELKDFGIEFDLNVSSLDPSDLIKYAFKKSFRDLNAGTELDVSKIGQGALRRLIYSLIKATSQISTKSEDLKEKKEFSPKLRLILFDEPEAFLHPKQQEILRDGLLKLTSNSETQVIITNHSPYFLSKNLDDLTNLIRLRKSGTITKCFQVKKDELSTLLSANMGYRDFLKSKLAVVNDMAKGIISKELTSYDWDLEGEALWYILMLDSDNCASFYGDRVILCEGVTDKVFIKHFLERDSDFQLKKNEFQIVNSNGKFNMHRFMSLFDKLGIEHSVLFDDDSNKGSHQFFNEFLRSNSNSHTMKIIPLDGNLEDFLGIGRPNKDRLKPVNALKQLKEHSIALEKIDKFKEKLQELVK